MEQPVFQAQLPDYISTDASFEWKKDWDMSDEFNNGPSSVWLRRNRWETSNKRWIGRKPGFFRTENVVVRDGSMRLWSREDQPPFPNYSGYKDFSTGFVKTKKARKYGYFEISAKLMDSRISSAFWFANNEPTLWTELDVFEYSTSDKKTWYGAPFGHSFNTNMHVHRHPDGVHFSRPKIFDVGFNLSESVVKVGFNWQIDSIEWYLNDSLLRKEDNEHFHQPLHLQLDSETFPNWFSLPEKYGNNKLPNFFEIFYVRSFYR